LQMGQDPDETATIFARLRAKYGVDGMGGQSADETPDAAPEPEKAEPAAEAAPEEAPPATEPEPEKKPEPEKPKQHSRQELQLARALDDNTRLQAELLELRKSDGASKGELEQLRAAIKKNPFKAIEKLYGKTLPELIEMGKKGEFDKADIEMPPEVQEAVEYAKQAKAEAARRQAAEQRAANIAADKPKVQRFLESFAAEYPLAAALDDEGVDAIVEEYYERLDKNPKGPKPDLRLVAKEMEERAASHFGSIFSNAKLVRHAAGTDAFVAAVKAAAEDPKVRKKFTEALGLAEQQTPAPTSSSPGAKPQPNKTPPAQPPKSVAGQTEVPERAPRELTEEEERAERLRLFRQAREAGRFASD
jgi:hypothetical protein